jgi:hypothetical protein
MLMRRHAPGVPLRKVLPAERTRGQCVVAKHAQVLGEHVRASRPGRGSDVREPAQPTIEFGGAAAELIELMIARERRDPQFAQGAVG